MAKHITQYHFCVLGVTKAALLTILEEAITSLLFTCAVWNEEKQVFTVDLFHNLRHTKFKVCVLPGDDERCWWLNFKSFACSDSRELGVYAYHMIAAWEPLYSLTQFNLTHPDYTPHYVYERHVLPCGASRLEVVKVLVKHGFYCHLLHDEEVFAALDKEYVPVDVQQHGLVDDDRFDVCVYPSNQSEEHGAAAAVPRYHMVGNVRCEFILQQVYPMLLNHMRKYGLFELVRMLRRPSNVPACSEAEVVAMLHGLMDQFEADQSAPLLEAYLIYECATQIRSLNAPTYFPGADKCFHRASLIFQVARARLCAACKAQYSLVRAEPVPTGYEADRLYVQCVVCRQVSQ